MDNQHGKKLPSAVLPTVSGDNYVIVETPDGAIYFVDSDGAKRLLTVDEKYDVGDIVIRTEGTSPAEKYGGTWEQLPNNVALWIVSSNGGTVIEAGLPNIVGSMRVREGYFSDTYKNYDIINRQKSGALSVTASSGTATTDSVQIAGAQQVWDNIAFDASQSNGIYGKSTTVQPPAYGVYGWQKIAN